jgi:hypothetical protein
MVHAKVRNILDNDIIAKFFRKQMALQSGLFSGYKTVKQVIKKIAIGDCNPTFFEVSEKKYIEVRI